ncbi:MAG: RBBP9/YdeN family alpha/beta hydrolase [Thermoleophilaceae bacterium]
MLHGWQGSGPDHWQTWLAERLRALGEDVSYPGLPSPDAPRLDDWLGALRDELEAARGSELVVLCHSLAGIVWLHHAARPVSDVVADRVLLAAPPCPPWTAPELAAFPYARMDRAGVAQVARSTRMVSSDNDPYCPRGAANVYPAALGIECEVIPGAGHINTDSGYGPWPLAERFALEG